eukprot:snap_masked-scaffold_12-processed-gene-11.59-mRNA-1 protein AED:1.00 eAED:1.00 QI:0/0/0/0/1/1/2/0/293
MSRWGYQFQQVDMVVRHIPGEENVAADILSRWGNRYSEEVVKTDDSQTNFLMFINDIFILNVEVDLEDLNEATKIYGENRISFLYPWYKNKFKKPSDSELMDLQRRYLKKEIDDLVVRDSKIWIPWYIDFICRLIISNHISQNHVSTKQEEDLLKKSLSFDIPKGYNLKMLIQNFRLHPREIIHVDFLSINIECKIVVMVDSATCKVFMKVVEKEDTSNMALALIEFLGNFQFKNNFTLVTDNVSYFAGKLLQTLSEIYHFNRYFRIKFSPWTNGVVEVTNAKIVRIIRTLCS